MSNLTAYIPLSEYLERFLPDELLDLGDIEFLRTIAYQDGSISLNDQELSATLDLWVTGETSFEFLGGLALVIGEGSFSAFLNITFDEEKGISDFFLSINTELIKLRLPRSFFIPMIVDAEGNFRDSEGNFNVDSDPNHFVEIPIPFGISINKDFDIEIQEPPEGWGISLPACMLGESKVVVSASNIILNLSKGLYIEKASIHLPPDLQSAIPDNIELEKCFIGDGGFSGEVDLHWTPSLSKELFGLGFALEHFGLDFKQNVITKGEIKGVISEIPFFDAPLGVEISIASNGDFLIGLAASDQERAEAVEAEGGTAASGEEAAEAEGGAAEEAKPKGKHLYTLTKEGILKLVLDSVSISYKNKVFSFTVGGELTPLFGTSDDPKSLKWPSFDLKSLTIDSLGKVKIGGGWLDLPKAKALDFHGFNVEISKFGFGKEISFGENWVGFSGGVQIIESLPLKGSVDGLKIFWGGGSPRFEISGISVSCEIKNVLTFDGSVLFINEEHDKGFKGNVRVGIIPLEGMEFQAEIVAGRYTPPAAAHYNYFYLFIRLDLPVGIPLGCTGLAIYGFAGLFGYNMDINKSPDEDWVAFFLRPKLGITDFSKWTKSKDALAFGAGLTFGTSSDNGFNFAARALFVVIIPGPVIFLQGKATLVQKRTDLTANSPLTVFAVFDNRSGTILLNLQAQFSYPRDSGDLITVNANGEIYFNFNNPTAWHVYLGQETPESKRVRGKIIKLFDAWSFFMLDHHIFITGGGISFKKKWGIKGASITLKAWAEGRLGISWKPLQAEGSLSMGGEVTIKIVGIGIGLSTSALLAAKTPTPWYIRGEFKVKVNLPWPVPDIKAKCTIEWKDQHEKTPPYPLPLVSIGLEHHKVNEAWPLKRISSYASGNPTPEFASSLNYQSPADPNWDERVTDHPDTLVYPVVPLDAKLSLHFARPILDNAEIGKNSDPVEREDSVGEYKCRYYLKEIFIEKKEKKVNSPWTLYAKTRAEEVSGETALSGSWQITTEEGAKNLKLMLGVDSPFAFSRNLQSNGSFLTPFALKKDNYPCLGDEAKPKTLCIDYEDLPKNAVFFPTLMHYNLFYYANGFIQVVDEKGDRGITVVRSIEPKFITFENFYVPKRKKRFSWKGVHFQAGTDAEGFPLFFEKQKDVPYIPFSPPKKERATPLRLELPEGVDILTVYCQHEKELLVEAYNKENKKVASAVHRKRTLTPAKMTLEGKGIAYVEFIGVNISLQQISYQSKEESRDSALSASDLTNSLNMAVLPAPAMAIKNTLLILFPEDISSVTIDFKKGSRGTILSYDENHETVSQVSFGLSIIAHERNFIKIEKEGKTFRLLSIIGEFTILNMCLVTGEEAIRSQQTLDRFTKVRDTLSEDWKSQNVPLLDPQCYYRVTVKTEVKRKKGGGNWSTQAFTEHAFFQTENPPGIFTPVPRQEMDATNPPEPLPYPQGGMLKDLSAYVLETIPHTAPPNEEVRPFYCSYDVGVKFNEPLGVVNAMYEKIKMPLEIRLFDNNDLPILDAEGRPVAMTNHWDKNRELLLTREEIQWKEFLDESGCIKVATDYNYPEPSNLYLNMKGVSLLPQTLYKAKLVAKKADPIPGEHALALRAQEKMYPVYEFSFTTSRYAHFIDHIHSFVGRAWNHYRLSGSGAEPLLSQHQLSQVQELLGEAKEIHTSSEYHKEQEEEKFQQLLELFRLGTRQHPEKLETLLLNDKNAIYGLLLESPEPIEWERVTFTLKGAENKVNILESKAPVKIIEGSLRQHWVELLLTEDIDLSGWKIEKSISAFESTHYYTFSQGQKFSRGTLLKIHSGMPPTPPVIDDAVHLYTFEEGIEPEEGLMLARAETFRLLDKEGNIVHIYTKDPFVRILKTVLIRNFDQSKAFIFVTNDTSRHQMLTSKRYILDFAFAKDIGIQGPLLKKKNLSERETAAIEFCPEDSLPIANSIVIS